MTQTAMYHSLLQIAQTPGLPMVARAAVKFAVMVTKWHHNARSRRALKRLDSRLLDDIGITPKQAHAEEKRPFWME